MAARVLWNQRTFALLVLLAFWATLLLGASACFFMRPSDGGGQTRGAQKPLTSSPQVLVPEGYRIERVAHGLTFPTGVAFDESGRAHVVEGGYSYGELFEMPRLLAVDDDGSVHEIARGDRHGWNGVAFADGAFFVAEAGVTIPGRILKIDKQGTTAVVVDDLPSLGDHHVNGPLVRDGFVYFGIGTATNSGVVGVDNEQMGWLQRSPAFHDVPCEDLALNDERFTSDNPLTPDDDRAVTGPFQPFGSAGAATVKGAVPCSGAVLRTSTNGAGAIELVAWGFRNPFGFAVDVEGRLFVSDNGYDQRGSRPIYGNADWLWEVKPGAWYGWPDYAEGNSVTDDRYGTLGSPKRRKVLARDPGPVQQPRARFAVHSSSNGFDFSRAAAFGHEGQAFVAQFGDMAPGVGKVLAPVGFQVVRVDVDTGVIEPFAANAGPEHGPASLLGIDGIERPIAARFDPSGAALYVVDFGVMNIGKLGPLPQKATGALWKITRSH
ncbi:MAG: PQQ-dependent sugar dehydrogenase [Deltaproteobacteria bacterium]|nr:PQQ-dependent sugar dehydrogenase [Deltaproteobacteria bacterium]